MKNSDNKRMIKRQRSWEHKVKPCDNLDGASRRDNAEKAWNSGRSWTHIIEKLMPLRTPEEGINHLDEKRTRIMLCVSFTNLDWWQAMDLAYYLFSLKRIKRDIAQLGKVFNEPPEGFGKQRMNWYENEGRRILERTTVRIINEWSKGWITGKN